MPTAVKVELIERLLAAGLTHIEVGSFVSARWVPQMADTAAVMARLPPNPAGRYAVLVPNLKGFAAAKEAGAGEVAVFASASEAFSRANINCSIAESLERFRPVAEAARAAGIPLRGYVSCVLGCPYEGMVTPQAVADVASRLVAMGCYEVSLGDTIGAGHTGFRPGLRRGGGRDDPARAHRAACPRHAGAGARQHPRLPRTRRVGGRCRRAGLGGCPYAGGRPGNVATEAVVAEGTRPARPRDRDRSRSPRRGRPLHHRGARARPA